MIRTRALSLALLVVAGASACSSSSSAPASAGPASFCETMKTLPSIMKDAKDPESAKVAYGKLVETFQTLAAKAPTEIATDMKLLAGFSQRGYDLMKTYDFDFEKMASDPGMEALGKDQASDESKAASQRVDVYTKQTCGVDLSAVAPGG